MFFYSLRLRDVRPFQRKMQSRWCPWGGSEGVTDFVAGVTFNDAREGYAMISDVRGHQGVV